MPIRTILVATFGRTDLETVLQGALNVARRLEGHLDVLLVQPDPAGFFIDYPQAAASIAALETQNAASASAMRVRFEEWRETEDLPATIVDSMLRSVYARWSVSDGPPIQAFLSKARLADLILMARPHADAGIATLIADAALFASGRPVLVLPVPLKRPLLERVAVAWNSSLPAVRSLAAAMPFLHEAGAVDILAVAEPHSAENDPTMVSAAAVVAALSWQGVRARAVYPKILAGETAGVALLREAATLDISLIALGAFAQGQASAHFLDGVTGFLVQNSTVPLLLAS